MHPLEAGLRCAKDRREVRGTWWAKASTSLLHGVAESPAEKGIQSIKLVHQILYINKPTGTSSGEIEQVKAKEQNHWTGHRVLSQHQNPECAPSVLFVHGKLWVQKSLPLSLFKNMRCSAFILEKINLGPKKIPNNKLSQFSMGCFGVCSSPRSQRHILGAVTQKMIFCTPRETFIFLLSLGR